VGWQTTGDVAEFLAAAGPFLRADRVRNTVLLTVTETIRENPAIHRAGPAADPATDPGGLPLFGWWTVEAAVGGAFLHTPPFPVLLTAVPAAAAASLATATLAGRPVGGVNAYPEAAEAFAGAWQETTGGRVGEHRRDRLYRLAGLTWPDPRPDGAPRRADDGDVPLLTDWFGAFAREVNDFARDTDHTAAVRERLSYRGFTVWEADGKPVSLAGVTRQVAGMTRVGPVYTPPESRGHGYASAVTAAASERARAAGAEEVLLFTDLDNPVSNSIYQRIGYRPVEDRVVLSFSERSRPPAEGQAPQPRIRFAR
jgi:RimJ/RimL family protein N-acetyltransferase